MLKVIGDWVSRVVRAARFVATLTLLCSVALNFANIVGRYFLNSPIEWGEEVMLFLMVGIVFLAAVPVSAEGRQIKMDILVNMLPDPGRRALEVLAGLLEIGVVTAIAVIGIPVIKQLYMFDQRSQAANLPLYVPQAMVPLGLLLMALATAMRLVAGRDRPGPSPAAVDSRLREG